MPERHDYPINHWCAQLPDMKREEFQEFKDDIEHNGLKQPVDTTQPPGDWR